MYQVIIDFKKDISPAIRATLTETANKAFNNRAGHAKNVSDNPFRCIYEGKEELFGCLQLGCLALNKVYGFKKTLEAWNWIDENPNESCDVIESLSFPVSRC